MAAAESFAYPRWLLECKTEITQAEEWKALTEELHRAIQQQLTESHVSKFTDLSEPEKQLFLERAAKAVEQGDIFQNFNHATSKTLDQHLSNHANHELLTASPTETKSELILDQAREGSLGLLKRWPGHKAKLRRFLNQALPNRLRQITWRLFLRSPKVRASYLEQLKGDPNSVMSILDLEIIQTSEALLQQEPTFRELSNNTDILRAMKSILSYHHLCKNTKTSLIDTDYMLVIPFMVNVLSTTRPDQLVLDSTLSVLIEEYATFMSSRPIYMRESYVQNFQGSMESFTNQITAILQEKDELLAHHMERVFSGHFAGQSSMIQGMKSLVRPMVRCLFVGYLNLDAIMYIWDQYIIGLDRLEYDVIPSMTVCVLMMLRKYLVQCDSLPEMENQLKLTASKLTKDSLIYEIGRHFFQTLNHQLNSGQDATPVLDPTQVAMAWEHWHKEMLPPRVKAQDRRQERDKRDEQRQRERDGIEIHERLRHEEMITRKTPSTERMAADDLRRQLEQEREKREASETASALEIQRLKRDIEKLKQVPVKSAPSVPAKLPTPPAKIPTPPAKIPPAEQSRPDSNKPDPGPSHQTFAPGQLDDPIAARAVLTDVLKDFMDSSRKLQGGS